MTFSLNNFKWIHFAYACWLLATVSTLGSLTYSEVVGLQVCILCWYQRIVMYPLVFIFSMGILLNDKKVFYYAMPLIAIGLLVATFQVLLQAHIIPQELANCTVSWGGISCLEDSFKLLGFWTVPQQSLVAFLGLAGMSALALRSK